jgi:DNA-binding MarR family transcriptional regulator
MMLDRHDPRWSGDRDRSDLFERSPGSRGCATERDRRSAPRDAFTKDLDLPRGHRREFVRERDRVYEINGAESRMLATIGAFRIVSERDLQRCNESSDARSVRHLERAGLIRTSPLSTDDRAITLTSRGRELLETNRDDRDRRAYESRQTFYAGLRKPRERTHDAAVYRAFERAEERLRDQGARIERVVLDYELKRDYQRFLQERNRGRTDSDGRSDRTSEEIARWARQQGLPYYDEQVHFPDARIEYRDRDGLSRYEDLEVTTAHYRGAHAAAAARSGFTRYRAVGGVVGGRGGGRRMPDPKLAEEFIR